MRNLNKPPRYNVASVQAQQTLGGDVMQSAEDGQYVEWRDYAWLLSEKQRLQAEVERLRFAEDLLKDENQHLREEEPLPDGWNSAVAKACDILAEKDKENARLKAEVERLTKAGDAMADNCEAITSSEHDCYDSDLMKFVRAWNAAKEGKSQS